MKSLLVLAILAFSLLYSLPSFAQLKDSTTTNSRIIHDQLTLLINTSNVVAKGQLQLDIDYSLEQYSGYYYGWRMTIGSLPELKARYGLFKNVEARTGTRVGYMNRNYMDPSEGLPAHSFVDLFTIGVKATLASYNNAKGSLAILAESNAPLLRLSSYFMRDRFIPSIVLINENQLNSWLGYTLNAGTSYYVWERRAYSLQLAAAAHFYHNPNTISFIGFSQVGNPFYSGYSNLSLNSGFVYAVSPFLQLRTGFNLNLNSNTAYVPKMGGTIGLAWQPDFFRNK